MEYWHSISIYMTVQMEQWEQALSFIKKLVDQYLIGGRYADILKRALAIGIGFVDGDIEIIYHAIPLPTS